METATTLNPAIIAYDLRSMGLNAVATQAQNKWFIVILSVTDQSPKGIYPVSDYDDDSAGEKGAAQRIAWTHFGRPNGRK